MNLLWNIAHGGGKLYDLIVSLSGLHEENVRKILEFSIVKGILFYLAKWATQTEISLQSRYFNMNVTTS